MWVSALQLCVTRKLLQGCRLTPDVVNRRLSQVLSSGGSACALGCWRIYKNRLAAIRIQLRLLPATEPMNGHSMHLQGFGCRACIPHYIDISCRQVALLLILLLL
jgi:hypothetical protein